MKIALVMIDDFSMYHFRKGLIRKLVKHGYDVTVIVPPGKFTAKLEALGARVVLIPMHRFISPISDVRMFYRLWRIFRDEAFDIVHNMTIKPNIYGTIAARLAGIPRVVCLVSGTGYMFFQNEKFLEKLLHKVVVSLYRLAMRFAHKTWFQNPDDLQYFVRAGIIEQEKGVLIRSGGINTEEFALDRVSREEIESLRAEFHIPPNTKCVLMVTARLIWSKGVREFVEAAEALSQRFPEWCFIMVCPNDPGSPDHVPEEYVRTHRNDKLIIVDFFRYDIEVFEAMADIMVLPSYYREGVPRTLLEGLSMGKPIITTDHPGCREAVDEGMNGYLIPIRDFRSLVDRLEKIMSDPLKRNEFGKHARYKAVHEFSETLVISKIMQELYHIQG